MAFYTVTMTHPDGPGWGEHARAHVDYLRELVARGALRASGPLRGEAKRAGFLIFQTEDRGLAERCGWFNRVPSGRVGQLRRGVRRVSHVLRELRSAPSRIM